MFDFEKFRTQCDETRKRLAILKCFGDWNGERDFYEFEHAGLVCRISRHPELFHLNGYVGVPFNHSLYGSTRDFDVHGGVTFHGVFEKDKRSLYWFGFDCAHYGDLVPLTYALLSSQNETPGYAKIRSLKTEVYRNFSWVTSEVKRLAEMIYETEYEYVDRSCDD